MLLNRLCTMVPAGVASLGGSLPNVCDLWASVKANAGCFAYVLVWLCAGYTDFILRSPIPHAFSNHRNPLCATTLLLNYRKCVLYLNLLCAVVRIYCHWYMGNDGDNSENGNGAKRVERI